MCQDLWSLLKHTSLRAIRRLAQDDIAPSKSKNSYTFISFNSISHSHYHILPLIIKIRWLHYGFHQYCWVNTVPFYHVVRKYFSDTEQDEWYITQVCLQICAFRCQNNNKKLYKSIWINKEIFVDFSQTRNPNSRADTTI